MRPMYSLDTGRLLGLISGPERERDVTAVNSCQQEVHSKFCAHRFV